MRTTWIVPAAGGLLLVAGLVGGCASASPSRAESGAGSGAATVARPPSPAELRATEIRALRGDVPAEAVERLGADLASENAAVRSEAAFRLGVSRHESAPARLREVSGEDAAAAAMGLGYHPDDSAEDALVALATDGTVEAMEALFSHYRWRGRPAPQALPDPRLLEFSSHPSVRGRASLGHLARTVKDPRVVPHLARLVQDVDWEVRRAAALGLVSSSANPWGAAEARQALPALRTLASDPNEHVRVAACRALSSFDSGAVLAPLRKNLADESYHVRTAAIAGLSRRKDMASADAFERIAREDPSVSVRHDAATSLAALDAPRAARLVDSLLRDDAEYVRSAAATVLAAQEGSAAVARIVDIASSDPHVRVRGGALSALKGKKGAGIEPLLRRVLTDDADPVLVNYACEVAASNDLRSLAPLVRAVPARFPGMDGADARAGALDALAGWEGVSDEGVLAAHENDPHPAVAFTAAKALAKRAGAEDDPEPRRTQVVGASEADMASPPRIPMMILETTRGRIHIRLFPEKAPIHVAHVTALANRGHYDGLTWHRVVGDFVIQGGCPRGDGSGAAGVSLPLEPTLEPFVRGTLGMPRSSHPDSGGCQLFIMHSRAPHLDVHYTAFGRVTNGLDRRRSDRRGRPHPVGARRPARRPPRRGAGRRRARVTSGDRAGMCGP